MNLQMRDFAIRDLGCTACAIEGVGYPVMCEKHHLNEGDQPGSRRRGEAYTVGLCRWHHTGHCFHDGSIRECEQCKRTHGPSWRHHKREFLIAYGTGDELLAVQNHRIETWRKAA